VTEAQAALAQVVVDQHDVADGDAKARDAAVSVASVSLQSCLKHCFLLAAADQPRGLNVSPAAARTTTVLRVVRTGSDAPR